MFKDLFDFVEKKCDFRYMKRRKKIVKNVVWTCYGNLKFTSEFLRENIPNITDSINIIKRLNHTGGYCDCEVIFNSKEVIDGEEKLE